MRKYIILLIAYLSVIKIYSINMDSSYRHSFMLGQYSTYFTKDIYYSTTNESFYNEDPRYGVFIGYDYNKAMSERKSIGVSAFVSNSFTSYLYRSTINSVTSDIRGTIKFSIFSISPQYKYYVFKWVNIRLGLPVNLLLFDKFDNIQVAKNINWYNQNGKSNFNRVYLSYLAALDFNVYKRIGVSLSFINGITYAGTLKTNNLNYTYKEKLVSGYISLNYKIR